MRSAASASPRDGPEEADGSGWLARLREGAAAPEENPLVIATLAVRIPDSIWLGEFTRRHPDVLVEVLNQTETSGGRSVADHWIAGGSPGRWTKEIASHGDVSSVDCLTEMADGFVYRVTFATPPIVAFYRELGIPLRFPLRVRAGQIFWEVCARGAHFRQIWAFARQTDPHASVLSLRRRPLRSHLPELTVAQRTLLTRAMAEGYFAVPRRITLTQLARKLGRSKSTTSESLALIEKKVLESALRPTLALT